MPLAIRPAESRTYSDSQLKEIRKRLTPVEEQVLKALHTNPIMIRNTLSLENEVVKKESERKIADVKDAIRDLERKRLLKSDGDVSNPITSLTKNGIYLFLVTNLRNDVTIKTFQS